MLCVEDTQRFVVLLFASRISASRNRAICFNSSSPTCRITHMSAPWAPAASPFSKSCAATMARTRRVAGAGVLVGELVIASLPLQHRWRERRR